MIAGQAGVQVATGTELVPFQLPRNPNDVEPPGVTVPLLLTFVAVTVDPLVASDAFQTCVMVWPLAYVQVTRHPLIVAVPAFVTTT